MRLLIFLFISRFLIFATNADNLSNSSLVVTLENGNIVEGFDVSTLSGARARVFLGIPYAQPPMGELRFQKTRSLETKHSDNETISERISCLAYKPSCWQNHSHIDQPITDLSEDCLYVNIFSSYTCRRSAACPVLYYIHGGAYESDGPSMFPVETMVENFATHGLVLVTVAYRLGILGFWSTGGDEAVGNYALYDVIEGLRWVQREIHAFGGDPNQVTIMGHSSGGAFASLLTLTPQAQGLFKSAVIMSASPTLSTDLSDYHRLAEDVGCARNLDWHSNHRYDKQILQCMRRVPVDILVNLYRGLEDERNNDVHTTPLFDGPDGLFPLPLNQLMLDRPKYDAVIGTTKNEMGKDKYKNINATIESLSDLCRSIVSDLTLQKNKRLVVFQCQRLYVDSALEKLQSKNESQLQQEKFSVWTERSIDLKSDVRYFAPTFREASSLAEAGGKVYLYSFDYEKSGLEGVSPWHSFDLTYVMGIHPFLFDDRDYAIKSIYVPLFVNFAKFGNPTPPSTKWGKNSSVSESNQEWKSLQTFPMDMNYFSVDLPRAKMEKGYHYDGVLFWDYIVPAVGGSRKREPRQRFLRIAPSNGSGTEETVPAIEDDGTYWRKAFWITLTVALIILASAGSYCLIKVVRRRHWNCWCFCTCPKKKKQDDEEEGALLASMKHADSYATFY